MMKNENINNLIDYISAISHFVDIYTLVVYPIILAVFSFYHERPMVIVLIMSTCIEVLFVFFKFKEKKIFPKFKEQLKDIDAAKELYTKQGELSDLRETQNGLINFLELITSIDISSTIFLETRDISADMLNNFTTKKILNVLYERSNIFGIADNYSSKFKIVIYHWAPDKDKLIPSFCASRNLICTFYQWKPFEGCTGKAFGRKQMVKVENLSKNEILETVKNRPQVWDNYYKSLLSFPIMIREDETPVGVITLSCNIENHFTRLHEIELSMIAAQLYRILKFSQLNNIALPVLEQEMISKE